jgi:protoheme IX farnesyltransferase
MPLESFIRTSTRPTLLQRALILIATAAYGLALLGGISRTVAATLVSAAAIAALGAALFAYVASRVGPAAQRRLGGRAQAGQRRYRVLLFAAVGAVYMTLVAGVLVTNVGGMWVCLALPVCSTSGNLAVVAVSHRVLAGLAALLVLVLAVQTWRTRGERPLRRAAGWSLGLMLVQIIIGLVMIQVVLASGAEGLSVPTLRLTHLSAGIAAWGALVVQMALALRLPYRPTIVDRPFDQAQGRRPTTVSQPQPVVGGRWSVVFKDYVSLTKPGVITLLIFTTVASMYITPADAPSLALVFWTFVGGWLMASGAHAVNCWADRDIDVNMGRTSRRPIPSGRIPARHALILGIVLGAAAFAILAVFVNWAAALLSLAGYLYYVLIYTRWLKRTTPSNIVIGGGAGAFPPLVGWAAATGGLTMPSLLLFAIIFYWTPPHFWALALIREKDYTRASVPMLPVVAGDGETRRQIVLYTLMMLALTIMPTPLGMFGLPYLAMAAVLGALFLRYAVRLYRAGTTAAAWGLYKYSLLYLALLFVAMVIDRVAFP